MRPWLTSAYTARIVPSRSSRIQAAAVCCASPRNVAGAQARRTPLRSAVAISSRASEAARAIGFSL